jgi:spermidine/putrescine transport system permease protein
MSGPKLELAAIRVVLYGGFAAALALFYLPLLTLLVFSVREGRHLVLPFDGVTLKWYAAIFEHPDFPEAARNSLLLAGVTMLASTILGTLFALGLQRVRLRGKKAIGAFVLSPIAMPQLLLGIILLLWFAMGANLLDYSLGLWSAAIGHIVYAMPFATVVVSVQLAGLDRSLEEAAADCGASAWEIYRDITLPLLWPGILSAAIFSFLLSWSNFYISFNLAGTSSVLPTFVYAGLAYNSSPLYPALATLVLIPMAVLVGVAEALRRRGVTQASANPGSSAEVTP